MPTLPHTDPATDRHLARLEARAASPLGRLAPLIVFGGLGLSALLAVALAAFTATTDPIEVAPAAYFTHDHDDQGASV